MMKNGVYFNSILGCRAIQDFHWCKLDDLWRHKIDTKCVKIKKWNISEDILSIEPKLCTVVILITTFHGMSFVTFPWQHNGFQALSIQRVKSESPSFKKCYLLLMFIRWVRANRDITQHKHKKVCQTLEQRIRHFSLFEGRGLVTSMLQWWHHNHYHNV